MSAQLLMKIGEGRGQNRTLSQFEFEDWFEQSFNGFSSAEQSMEHTRAVQKWARLTLGFLAELEDFWLMCWQEVTAGNTSNIHNLRGDLQEIVQTRMGLLRKALAAVQALQKKSGERLPEETSLLQELAGFERIERTILDRWQCADDLEDLVAEQTAPSEQELDAIAAKYGPPKVWLEQCGEPRVKQS